MYSAETVKSLSQSDFNYSEAFGRKTTQKKTTPEGVASLIPHLQLQGARILGGGHFFLFFK